MATRVVCGGAAAAGALSHWTYFIRGEHHLDAPIILRLALLLPALTIVGLWQITSMTFVQSTIWTAQVVACYSTALWTSIIVYRVFFHRLKSFPGPLGASVSKLWHVNKLAPRSDNYMLLERLHETYGDFVRTGPEEISIFDPDAIPIILGPGSKCIKAPWYDSTRPIFTLHTMRDKSMHDRRRRIWDKGFGAKALRAYEDRVTSYSKDLLFQIQSFSGQAINATDWLHYYSFDVMGEIAFGRSFDMLKNGQSHFALDLLAEGMKPLGLFGPVPWMFNILSSIPGLGAGLAVFVSWCGDQVEQRKKIEVKEPDVMSWLIDSAATSNPQTRAAEELLLRNDSRLIIVAGSDTTAATLTYTFYHLAQDHSQVEKLRDELRRFRGPNGEFDLKSLEKAEHLNGVINESLRLHPPVPSGTLRVTPSEGININGTFIPGNVTVVAPPYSLGRLESCYQQATEFVPERWYSRPEMVKNKNGFAPFSLGPWSCVGKQLALIELRSVIALLVSEMDVTFAPGEDGSRLIKDSKDYFTITLSDLKLVFTKVR